MRRYPRKTLILHGLGRLSCLDTIPGKCQGGDFRLTNEHRIHSFFHRLVVISQSKAQKKETSNEVSFRLEQKAYLGAGAAACGVVAGRGRAAEGAAGGGAVTPEEALYAVTTA